MHICEQLNEQSTVQITCNTQKLTPPNLPEKPHLKKKKKKKKKTSSIDSVYALTPTDNAMQRYNWLFLTRTRV